ncbi:hypothetical protein [Vibrio navarrensis]|uniref:hypothetical protein n=1 Tax=Vibrio navarrensis TaxID=29495 RepID=UPI001869FAE3|nr:hypothetical protein [Vibrio navarrensis]MBE4579858.1 hypothetical protein [Vibrio navarrensis]
MANNPQNLPFHIDLEELEAIQNILGATESQVKAAYNRALSRTAQTLRKIASPLIREELQPRTMSKLRKRIKHFQIKNTSGLRNLGEVKLWFGLNDVPVGLLKGSMKRLGTKKNSKGSQFTPRGKLSSRKYRHGFIGRPYKDGYKSIYIRRTKFRYPLDEASMGISDSLQITIEDEIFDRLPEIFLKHFETDLKGRVKMGLNRRGWRE